ncbi:MAG: DUF2202 domain-containing protein [Gammaproteobacteria bacterium]|jgi:hypothetical protein
MRALQLILKTSLATIAAITISNAAANTAAGEGSIPQLDFNEQTHLVFTCEEEKLARDVYRVLGRRFPEIGSFAVMAENKENSNCAVDELLQKYRVSVPRVNHNVGVFSWGIYGRYFTEKYLVLTNQGTSNPLNALYVGAFIEELNIQDINHCPKVLVDINNGINDDSACGMNYTDNPDVLAVYEDLLDESRKHLRLLVGDIENVIGSGNYQAQVLQQDEVDAILSPRQVAQP